MSTFGALNTAYRGLTAAQQGMNVAGQNIANAATEGYTRQRVDQSSLAAPARGLFSGGTLQPGQGVSVDAIARLGNSFLDGSVRSAGAQAGYASVRSSALQGIEGVLQEPGENGISTALQGFWSAWQAAANQPSEDGPKGLLLNAANSVTDKISSAYQALDSQWSRTRAQASDSVDAVNAAAAQVASYNTTIRSTLAAGGSANELIDARARLTDKIASLAGGTVREQPDGTVDVLVGGNALVTGGSVRTLALSGSSSDRMGSSVQLVWKNPAGVATPDGGELAGALSVLAPASGGSGGVIAEAAESYNKFASAFADAVNPSMPRASRVSGTCRRQTSSPPAAPALPRSASRARPTSPALPSSHRRAAPWTPALRTRSPSSAPARVPRTRSGQASSPVSASSHAAPSSMNPSPQRRRPQR